jgi:hypothetical protein
MICNLQLDRPKAVDVAGYSPSDLRLHLEARECMDDSYRDY